MNRILALLMVVFFISCDKEETQLLPNANPIDHYSLQISVLDCAMEQCLDPVAAADLEVKIYITLEDALNDTNQLANRTTNEEGIIFINIQASISVYLRVDHPTDGVYISNKITLSKNITTQHQIVFRGNLIYNYDHIIHKRQDHISFEYPTVGQVSNYKHFNNTGQTKHTIAQEYSDITLTVTIKEQLSEHIFIVEELVSSIPQEYEFIDKLVLTSEWEFDGSNLYIRYLSPEDTGELVSYLFNFRYSYNSPSSYYCLIHCPEFNDEIDFDENYMSFLSWKCAPVKPFELNNTYYDNATSMYDNLHGVSDYYKVKAYNFEDGIIRSINIRFDPRKTYGFDLVL